jgi:hypothetical protein
VKVISTILLFAGLFTMLYVNIGQLGNFYVGIHEAKEEAVGRLNVERLSTLTITKADISSGRASFVGKNELQYNGNLYDIASQSRQGDHIILHVLRDNKEEGLMSNLKEVIDGWVANPQKDTKHPSLKQLVILKDYIPAHKFNFSFNSTIKELPSGNYSYPLEAPLLSVLKSPPKFV